MTFYARTDSRYAGAQVLVTGGCGFIGSHLVEALVGQDAQVTVLDNFQAGARDNLEAVVGKVQIREGDVRHRAVVEPLIGELRPQFVFHLAANASVPSSVQDPMYDFEANCDGTFILLNALRLTGGCEKVVVASSGAVYGEPASFPIMETDLLRPISPYGASKLCAEVEARMFQAVYGVPTVIARIFNTYGPRMARFVVLDFLKKLQHDPTRLEVLGSGQQVRDFTYVSDTVKGLLILAECGVTGEAYNLSSGQYYSVTNLAHKLIAVLGLSATTEIYYTGSSWVGDAQRWEVAIDKIAALSYCSEVSLEEGLSLTSDWFNQIPYCH